MTDGVTEAQRWSAQADMATAAAKPRQHGGIDIEHLFTHHPPTGDQPARYAAIRAAAKQLAQAIVDNSPQGADQSAAIRLLREAVMTANAAIALEGVAGGGLKTPG